MKNSVVAALLIALTASSCVSKKKYVALQDNYEQTQSALTKSNFEKEELQNKFSRIEARVSDNNKKLVSLADENSALTIENASKLDMLPGGIAMSNTNKEQLKATLSTMDPSVVAGAQTLKDSINLAINHNLIASGEPGSEDINVNIGKSYYGGLTPMILVDVVNMMMSGNTFFNAGIKFPFLGNHQPNLLMIDSHQLPLHLN